MEREAWLKVRNTPRKPKRDRMVHQSTNLVQLKDGPFKGKLVQIGKGKTYVRPEK